MKIQDGSSVQESHYQLVLRHSSRNSARNSDGAESMARKTATSGSHIFLCISPTSRRSDCTSADSKEQNKKAKPPQAETDEAKGQNSSVISESCCAENLRMMSVPQGDFENDRALNPLKLPQKTIDECLKYKTEITSRIADMDKRIKDRCEQEDLIYRGQFNLDNLLNSGPMNPNCVIAEDEFSPITEVTGCMTKDLSVGQAVIFNHEKGQLKNDFTSQSTDMIQKFTSTHISKCVSTELTATRLNPSRNKDVLINLQVNEAAANDQINWSSERNDALTARNSLNPSDNKRLPPSAVHSPSPDSKIISQYQRNLEYLTAVGKDEASTGSNLMQKAIFRMKSHNRYSEYFREPTSAIEQEPLHLQQLGLPDINQNMNDGVTTTGLTELLDKRKSFFFTQSAPTSKEEDSSVRPVEKRQNDSESVQTFCYLPKEQPLRKQGKKTLVIDLDETLVHSSFKPISNPDFTFTINISNIPNQVMNQKVYACKRPFCDKFLEAIAPHFEMVMFTASMSRYAEQLMKKLDPKGRLFDSCLYREHCTFYKREFYVKDLTRLGRPIQDIIILDNAPNSYLFQPQNALPCSSWFDCQNDCELSFLIPIVEKLGKFKGDTRRILRKIVPKSHDQKLDIVKANKTLNRALTRQEKLEERNALLSQRDSQNVRSVGSTSSLAFDSQTFASARSYAQIHKSQMSFRDTKKPMPNLISFGQKENESMKDIPALKEHLTHKLVQCRQSQGRNHFDHGSAPTLKPITNIPSVNYLLPTNFSSTGSLDLQSVTSTKYYQKVINKLQGIDKQHLTEQIMLGKRTAATCQGDTRQDGKRNTCVLSQNSTSTQLVDLLSVQKSFHSRQTALKAIPSNNTLAQSRKINTELLENSIEIEKALDSLQDLDNVESQQCRPSQILTPQLKAPVPLVARKPSKFSQRRGTNISEKLDLRNSKIQQLDARIEKEYQSINETSQFSPRTVSLDIPTIQSICQPLTHRKNIQLKPTHVQKLLKRFEKKPKPDSQQSQQQRPGGLKVPKLNLNNVTNSLAHKLASKSTARTDLHKSRSTRSKILNTDLPSSLLLALQAQQNLSSGKNLNEQRSIMAPQGTLSQITKFDIPALTARQDQISKLNSFYDIQDAQNNHASFVRHRAVNAKVATRSRTHSINPQSNLNAAFKPKAHNFQPGAASQSINNLSDQLQSIREQQSRNHQKSLTNTLTPLEIQIQRKLHPVFAENASIFDISKSTSSVPYRQHLMPLAANKRTNIATTSCQSHLKQSQKLSINRQNVQRKPAQTTNEHSQVDCSSIEAPTTTEKDNSSCAVLIAKPSAVAPNLSAQLHSEGKAQCVEQEQLKKKNQSDLRQSFISKVVLFEHTRNRSNGGTIQPKMTYEQRSSLELSTSKEQQSHQLQTDNYSTKTLGQMNSVPAIAVPKDSTSKNRIVTKISASPSQTSPLQDVNSFGEVSILIQEGHDKVENQRLADGSKVFKDALMSIHEETSSILDATPALTSENTTARISAIKGHQVMLKKEPTQLLKSQQQKIEARKAPMQSLQPEAVPHLVVLMNQTRASDSQSAATIFEVNATFEDRLQ